MVEQESIMEKIKKVANKFNKILTDKNILIVLAVYVIGTIIVMVRNFNEGIPFSAYSIITYAILTFYFAILFGVSAFLMYWLELIIYGEYKGNKFVMLIKKFLSALTIIFLISILMFSIMNLLLYNTENNIIIAHIVLLYCFWPLVGVFNKRRRIKDFVILMIILFSLNVIFNIPASIGGLKATKVKFCSYNDNIVYDYLYYGESNGNFIFKEDKNKIILRSCDSGYIEYYRDDNIEAEDMKYKIEIKETLSKVIEVEAKDEGEALRKIEERYKNSEIILDSGDYVKTEIQVYRD